jgi:hypothetical protein
MAWDSKLYPWQPVQFFSTKDEALAYALEVAGYQELWEWITTADQHGFLSAN